jgi:hypothetical protein
MALDDFDSIPANLRPTSSSGPDDEDLFDFPAVDLAGQAAPAPVTPPAATPSPVPLPTRAPIATPVTPPAPQASSAPSAPVSARPAPLPPPTDDSQRGPLPSAPPIARKPALTSVMPDPIASPALETTDSPVTTGRPRRSLPGSRTTWLVAGVLALNVIGFTILWLSNRSYRSGLEGLRDDLVVTMHDLRRNASESAYSVQAAPAEPVPSSSTEHAESQASPLAPHEETTLLLARQEIEDGEHVQARKRLYRLLAVADRIDSDLRKEIEARAMYLVGDSYRRQADVRREEKP